MVVTEQSALTTLIQFLTNKLKDYSILVKMRLNLTVVFSALIGYFLAVGTGINIWAIFWLSIGGFLVTASANALNQVIEKDYDKLMARTRNRPLATDRMSTTEGLLVAGIAGLVGLLSLVYCFSEMTALIGALSLVCYAFIYTPLKRINSIAVFVGAIPGALPPVIGWVAATGQLGYEALVLFSIQFLWQFPHFWAIGWLGAEQYQKAGYKLSPNVDQRNKSMAIQILLYIAVLILVSLIPFFIGLVSWLSLFAALLLGGMFLKYGFHLFQDCNNRAALRLMFASIIYLPVLQTIMVLDRLFFL